MKNLFSVNRGQYSAVGQVDRVYEPTTEPNPESLSPTQAVFLNYLEGRFSRNNNKKSWVFTTLVCGLCAITLGSLIVAIDPYQIIFKMKVTFTEGGESFGMWKAPEIDLFLKVYLFNVSNPDAFLKGEEKLRFNQVGPFVYRERLSHENVSFNENGTITATPLHPLEYMPELSNGTEDDLLILPNIALLSISQVMSKASFFTRGAMNLLIKQTNTKPLVEMTAKEFMFGYKSTLVTLGNKFMPNWISFDKLGLIDRMYDFKGDISTTFSGVKDIKKSGLLDTYNRRPYLPQWEAPCNNVSGASDGTKFNSLIAKNQSLLFFRKSLCRSMPLIRIGEEVVKGIHGYTYKFKDHAMDNGAVLPENKCFCLNGKCLPAGILDVQECYYGFPIALSYPHFFEADEKVLNSVEGLHPSKDLHSTYFTINEDAGLPLSLSVKMQINMAFGDLSKMANVKQFSNVILPMLWTDITMKELPTWMAIKFYVYLTLGPIAQIVSTYLLLIGGVAFILLSMASAILIPKLNFVSKNTDTIIQPSSSWNCESPIVKKRMPDENPNQENQKEMELYYCSLLAVEEENET